MNVDRIHKLLLQSQFGNQHPKHKIVANYTGLVRTLKTNEKTASCLVFEDSLNFIIIQQSLIKVLYLKLHLSNTYCSQLWFYVKNQIYL